MELAMQPAEPHIVQTPMFCLTVWQYKLEDMQKVKRDLHTVLVAPPRANFLYAELCTRGWMYHTHQLRGNATYSGCEHRSGHRVDDSLKHRQTI